MYKKEHYPVYNEYITDVITEIKLIRIFHGLCNNTC